MSLRRRLLQVDSMAGSLRVYLPATAVQRALNLVRTVVFAWLLGRAQYGLLGVATLVFGVGSSVVTLGAFQGIGRHVSQCRTAGQLRTLHRATLVHLTLLAAGLTAIALAASPWLWPWVMGTVAGESPIGPGERFATFALAVGNALAAGLYLNLTYWLRGLRLYRWMSLLDVLYALGFLGAGVPVLLAVPRAEAALVVHAGVLAVVLAIGLTVLHRVVRAGLPAAPAAPGAPPATEVPPDAPRVLGRVLRFSLPALAAMLLWQLQAAVSVWYLQRYHDVDEAGAYWPFFLLGQLIPTFATTGWMVVYSHAAVHWERGERALARRQLEVSFKAAAVALALLAAAACLAAPVWVRVLPPSMRAAREVLPWLLVFFTAVSNLGYAQVVSSLRERPAGWAAIALAVTGANVAFAALLVPGGGVMGAAAATGLAGSACAILGAGYLAWTGFGRDARVLLLHLLPGLFLLPPLAAAVAVAAVAVLSAATGLLFTPDEKRLLLQALRRRRSAQEP